MRLFLQWGTPLRKECRAAGTKKPGLAPGLGVVKTTVMNEIRPSGAEASGLDQADLIAAGGEFPTLVALNDHATT